MCKPADCTGCAYSKLSSLFHSGPRRECYSRFLVRHLPWNVLQRAIRKAEKELKRKTVARDTQGKEVWHAEHRHTLIAKSR